MCGRFANNERIPVMAQRFHAESTVAEEAWTATWNAKPTDLLPIIIGDARGRRLGLMRWGWPKDWSSREIHTTAVGHSAAVKKTFGDAFARRRCLIPVTSFYEWQTVKGKKFPYAFQTREGGLFAIAGLWQTFDIAGKREARFLLLTTPANALVAPVIDTMAAMLPPGSEDLWLQVGAPVERLRDLMVPFDETGMTRHRVSTAVNHVGARDGPHLMAPIEEGGDEFTAGTEFPNDDQKASP